jgi:DNA-binding NarL/FixJ family response regulator
MTRIYIADDHRVLLDGLRLVVAAENDMEFTGSCMTGEELLHALDNIDVEIVLLDINLPGMSGIEVCSVIRKRHPSIKIIGLSTYDKGSIVKKMLKAGASGYVLKNAGSEELLRAIRSVASGQTYISQQVNQILLDELTGSDKNRRDYIPELTRREKEVLRLIADEHTTPEIAEKLFISQNTVESHRKNLLHKFDVKNVAGLIRSAMEKGLLEY